MNIIYDVKPGKKGKVFSVIAGGISAKWTEDHLREFVFQNYGNVPGRRGAIIKFDCVAGDELNLDNAERPVSKAAPTISDVLVAASNGSPDFDLMAAVPADGKAIHTVTVRRMKSNGDVNAADNATIVHMRPTQFIPVSYTSLKLKSGIAVFSVGPSSMPGEVVVTVSDQSRALLPAEVRLRFL